MSLGIYKLQKSFYIYFVFCFRRGYKRKSIFFFLRLIIYILWCFWTNIIFSDTRYTTKFVT